MMNWLRTILGCSLLAAALVAQGTPSDDTLYDLVRIRLAQDVQVNGGAITVAVREGTVTLSGKIRSGKAKSKAEKIAGKVKGVKKVVNRLEVDPNAP